MDLQLKQRLTEGRIEDLLMNLDVTSMMLPPDFEVQALCASRLATIEALSIQVAFVAKCVGQAVAQSLSRKRYLIGVIGAGVVGRSVLDRLIEAGHPPTQLLVSSRRPELLERYAEMGVDVTSNNLEMATRGIRLLVVACPPSQLQTVATCLRGKLKRSTVLTSTVVGTTNARLDSLFSTVHCVRTCVHPDWFLADGDPGDEGEVATPAKPGTRDGLAGIERALAHLVGLDGADRRGFRKPVEEAGQLTRKLLLVPLMGALAEQGVALGLGVEGAWEVGARAVLGDQCAEPVLAAAKDAADEPCSQALGDGVERSDGGEGPLRQSIGNGLAGALDSAWLHAGARAAFSSHFIEVLSSADSSDGTSNDVF